MKQSIPYKESVVPQVVAREPTMASSLFSIKLLMIAFFFTGAALTWLSWSTYDLYSHNTIIEARIGRARELRGTIVHLDEVLTMSARMAAATGDPQWEARYRRFEPQLGQAIAEISKLSPSQMLDQTEAANLKLIEMENRAFTLVRENHNQEARAILFSREYEQQKEKYALGMYSFIEQLHDQLEEKQRSERNRAVFSASAGIVVLAVLLLIWLAIIRRMYKAHAILLSNITRRKQTEEVLRNAQHDLEVRVQERTAELTLANASLEGQIVERASAEEALRRSEELHRDLFENANDIIYTVDLAGNYTSVNKACEKIVGYTNAEALKMNVAQVIAPEYLEQTRAMLSRQNDENTPTAYELDIIAKDGHRVTLEVNSRLTYQNGKPSGVQGMARNITERKRAEEALRASETRFQIAFDHAPNGIALLTPVGRFLQVNKSFCAMLGYTKEELLALDVQSVTYREDRADSREFMRRLLAGEATTLQFEKRNAHKLGHEVFVLTNWSLVRDANAKPLYIISQIQDITERKRAEAERRALAEIVQGVVTTSSLDELLSLVHVAIGRLLPAENCFVALHDKTSGLLQIPFCKDEFDPVVPVKELGKGLTAFVLRSGRPMLLTPEMIQQLVLKGEIELIGTLPAAWLGVPLRTSTETIGVLVVQSYEKKDAYSQRDLELLAAVGDQLGLAIERKQIEIELKMNEVQLTDAQHIAKLGSWRWDVVANTVSWSKELYLIFGLQPQEFGATYEAYVSRVCPEDRLLVGQAIARAFEEKVLPDYDFRIVRPDGTLRTLQASGRLILDEAGNVIKMLGIAQDITERKHAEKELETNERLMSEAQRIAHLGSWEHDAASQEVKWSQEEWRIFGLDQREFGPPFEEFLAMVHPDDRHIVKSISERSPQSSKDFGYDYRIVRPDGAVRVLRANNSFVWDELGQVLKITGTDQDITEQRQIEDDLHHARDMALESARLKSEFLANMSHEIRTPMNGVIGMTGLLLDTNLNEEQRDCAETIRASGDALLTIINDILDFSKIEAGKLQFEMLDFDLSNAVESTVELLAERAHGKEIELASLIYSDVTRSLRGDPGRLRQVLTNLIGNAIKFTERGEVIVLAEKDRETDTDIVVRFTVTDTGIGINAAAQKNLFQAFTQADGSTTRKYGGTGLGLAISKQLIELMDGEIGVTSTEGKGSTFWFTARFAKQAAPVVNSKPDLLSLDRLHALIVDDNATNRKILAHQLDSWGMIHEEADSGARALDLLQSAAAGGTPYDLAILDFMMPGMDGFELARTIKSDPAIAAVPMVLLTSFGQRGDGAAARAAGIAAYLTKPVRQSQLFDCLANVIGQTLGSTAPAVPGSQLVTKHTLAEAIAISSKLILVAEDNIVNQKVAVRQLQKLGYRADTVADGREVLEALGRISYDLVLMDCQMPEMDGYEATAEIRRREGKAKHTPIVAMTAHALDGDRAKCLAAGMDEYITKPVKPEELNRVLQLFFNSASGGPLDESGAVSTPLVDVARMHEMMGTEPVEFSEMLNLYLNEMDENLNKLDAAVASGDPGEVESIAQNCAGTSANCGMTAVAIPFRQLENAGRTARLEVAPAALAHANKLFAQTRDFLAQHRLATAPALALR